MDPKRRNKLMFRWSLVSAGAIAIFWAGWHLVMGQVPVVTELAITPHWTIALPFGVSRWWDVLLGPIWSVLLIGGDSVVEKYGIIDDVAFGLGASLGAGLVFSLGAGLAYVCRATFSRKFWSSIGR